VSAFRGKHRSDTHDLGKFLDEVKRGRVPAGAYFIIESLDRLTREEIQPALLLVLGMLQAGVRIVQLTPVEMVYTAKSGPHEIMLMIVELMRGHSESKVKSERLTAVWGEKKSKARASRSVETTRVPGWLEVDGRRTEGKHKVGGRFVKVADRVKVVRRMFQLALEGYGLSAIVKTLTAERVPTWGQSAKWSKAYVRKIISGRAVLGEYQPRKGAEAEGEAVPDYYPAVIDTETWEAAQNALAGRRDRPGSPGKKVANLFSGMLWDGLTRSRMLVAWQTRGRPGSRSKARVLVSADSMEGRAATVSFPYDVFEEELLRHLAEIDTAEVFGNGLTSRVAELETQLAGVKARRAEVQAALEDPDGEGAAALARTDARLEEREAELTRQLAEERRKQANPPAAALAEAQALMGRPVGVGRLLVGAAKMEEARDRLRVLLRNAIEAVWVVAVAKGVYRLAHVRVIFREGGHRNYTMFVRGAGNGRERQVYSDSTTWVTEGEAPRPDVSTQAGAEKARQFMLGWPPDLLRNLLAHGH
jgi:DNA invertase Pin-like site-specific DNA recombinase